MKRILLLIIGVTANFYCVKAQEMDPQMEAFIARMDSGSLNEIEQELDKGIEGLKAFAGFFESPSEDQIKNYTPEEERFEKPFKIDTASVQKAFHQFNNIGFKQIFREDKSLLEFEKIGDDYWSTVWMEEGMEEQFNPKAIFYKDGTRTTEGIQNNEISFFFERPWGKIAVIDSVQIDYNIRYTAAYDSLDVDDKRKKINYKDANITVKKLEKNHVYLTVSDEYKERLSIRALNTDGKFLNQNSSSFSPTSDDKSEEGFDEMLALLEDVQTKLKSDKFKDTESLKNYLLKKVGKTKTVKDKDGVYHLKYYFEGNIESLRLFIQTEEKQKTVTFTAKNNSHFGDIILIQNRTNNIFLDADTKELFRTPFTPIQSLGSRYFQNDTLYYHLNLKTNTLDELKVEYVWEADNGLAFIQKSYEDPLLMYSVEYELLSDMHFIKIYIIDDEYVLGIGEENENYIINSKGVIKKLEGITNIRAPFDNRMAAKSNNKYGFLTTSGEIVIPFIYKEIEDFKNGFAIVENDENLFGIIDVNGVIVIPLIYDRILSHENGFTWVSIHNTYQLLNKDGKVLLTEKGSSYSISSSGADITLQFGDKRYDAYGNLIAED